MKTTRPVLRLIIACLVLLVVAFLVVRIFSHHAPTTDVLGSYFPAWMLCILSGLVMTLVSHWIIQVRQLKSYIGPGPVIYPCLMLIFTFLTWIVFYQN